MDYRNLSKEQLDEYADLLFTKLNSDEEVKNWISFFLDLDIPSETIFENSNSSPLNAIWTIYNAFLDNKSGEESPAGYVLMSAREGMKTISVAIVEVLLLLHFEIDIAHAASIESQSSIGLGYINNFLSKIEPLILHRGWTRDSQNKRTMTFTTPSGKTPYIKIIIASSKGFNGIHVNALFIDELDLADPTALKEATGIVSHSKNIYGKTIYLSTRKYAFGLMAQVIEKIDDLNYKLLSWNIIDTTESCPPSRHLPDLPTVTRYVANNLPLKQIDQDQYDFLAITEQAKFTKLENVNFGCTKCSLLPVCFVPGTPIRMSNGLLKPIEEVCVGDLVITHTGNSKKVTNIMNRKYVGNLIEIDAYGQNYKTLCTPEHPFLTSNGWKEAKDLTIGEKQKNGDKKTKGRVQNFDWLITPKINSGHQTIEMYTNIVLDKILIKNKRIVGLRRSRRDSNKDLKGFSSCPLEIPLNYKWGFICGLFLSEGSFGKGTRREQTEIGHPFRVCFSFHEKEKHLLNFVDSFAKTELSSATYISHARNSKGVQIDINSSIFAQLMKSWFGEHCDKKIIPDFMIENYNKEFLKGLFNGVYEGDGSKKHLNSEEFPTRKLIEQRCLVMANPNLIQKIQLIAWKLDINPTITKVSYRSYGGKQKRPTQGLLWSENDSLYKQVHESNYWNRTKHVKTNIDYNGLVYNIEVEDDNSYIVNSIAVHNCKMKLKDKPSSCSGGFWKPIASVKGKFAEYDPETAEAQLLCIRPGNTGLVYPRFVSAVDVESTNVISLNKAYEELTGIIINNCTEEMLLEQIKKREFKVDMSVDWGFRHNAVICAAVFVRDEVWVIDTFCSPGLEFSDIFEVAVKFRDRYEPEKWWVDQAMPQYIVTFNKANMKCPKFNKDVPAGISSLRTKIINGVGKRQFKVINTESNKKTIYALTRHKFKLDSLGEATETPDDENLISDVCDALRYLAQNKFPIRGAGKIHHVVSEPTNTAEQIAQTTNASFLKAVQEATGVQVVSKTTVTKKKGGIYFSW